MELTLIERIKAFLQQRQMAYKQVFAGPVAETVLKDLAQFCRATESTFHTDLRVHALLEGRREVWLRICQHLQLDEQELFRRFAGSSDTKGES